MGGSGVGLRDMRRFLNNGTLLLLLPISSCADEQEARVAPVFGLDFSSVEHVVFAGWPELRSIDEVEFLTPGERLTSDLRLHEVRDLLVLENDAIVVAHAGASEVLRIEPSGTVSWRSGGPGEGPGEFSAMGRLQAWEGDTLIAVDPALRRATFLSESGALARVLSGAWESPAPETPVVFSVPGQVIGVARTGELVLLGPTHARRMGEPGLRQARTHLTVISPSRGESRSETLANLPGLWAYELRNPQALPAILAPMSAGTPVAIFADVFAWARTDAFDVVVFDRGGRVHQVFSVDEPLDAVTSELRANYMDTWQPWFPVDESVPFPSHVPAFDRVFFSRQGDMWVRRFHWGEDVEQWARFSEDGQALDLFRFPPRVQIMAATRSHAFGVSRDEMDVERLVRLPL